MIALPKKLPNWKQVLTKAWSIKFGAAAMFFIVLDVVFQFLAGVRQNLIWVILSGLCSAAAFGTRLLAQANMENGNGSSKEDGSPEEVGSPEKA